MSKKGGVESFSFKFYPKPKKYSVSSSDPPPTPAIPALDPISETNVPVRDELAPTFRGKIKPPRNLSMRRRYYGVHGYWDFETAGLPITFRASTLEAMINSALQNFHPNLYLEDLIGFGDTRKFKTGDYDIIKDHFKKITDVTPREFCKKCSLTGNHRFLMVNFFFFFY